MTQLQSAPAPAQSQATQSPSAQVEAASIFAAAIAAHDAKVAQRAPVPIEGGELAPKDLEGLWRVATWLHQAGMLPRGVDRVEQVALVVAKGMQLGIGPVQALENIMVVNNRCSVWGDLALALARAARNPVTCKPIVKSVTETFNNSQTDPGYTCTVERVNDDGEIETITRSFTKYDAEVAGLWGKRGDNGKPTPWCTSPKRMLQMRARAFALRDAVPDVLKGIGVAEEVMDYTQTDDRPQPSKPTRSPVRAPSESAMSVLNNLPGGQAAQGPGGVAPEPGPAPSPEAAPDEFGDEMAQLMDNQIEKEAANPC